MFDFNTAQTIFVIIIYAVFAAVCAAYLARRSRP